MEEILAKSLAINPKDRYQHVGDFALDLRCLLAALESGKIPDPERLPLHRPGDATGCSRSPL
jgi:hypothetical protein